MSIILRHCYIGSVFEAKLVDKGVHHQQVIIPFVLQFLKTLYRTMTFLELP